jgi:hypothetical protein
MDVCIASLKVSLQLVKPVNDLNIYTLLEIERREDYSSPQV